MTENTENTTFKSAYAAAKYINEVLTNNSLKNVPPQMIYNYTSARIRVNQKPFIRVNEDGKLEKKDVDEWLSKYIAKKLSKA